MCPTLPYDRVTRRILERLSTHADVDIAAVARAVGVSEDVAGSRIAAMATAGVLRGLDVRVPPQAGWCEYFVSGVPTAETTHDAIARLCEAPGVTRVFGLASSHSLAFTLGSQAADAVDRALALAGEAGLENAEAVLIVNTFQDRRPVPVRAE